MTSVSLHAIALGGSVAAAITSLSRNLNLSDMIRMIDNLRADDHRIVRPSPSDTTKDQQNSLGCDRLPTVLSVLSDNESDLKITAAELVALCATENDDNRELIGRTKGVHAGVVRILSQYFFTDGRERNTTPAAVAAIVELIYTLRFNSAVNIEGLVSAGALSALSEFAVRCHPLGDQYEADPNRYPPYVRMRVAAAL